MHGTFIWHELITPDTAGARAFYGGLLGWESTAIDMGDYTYTTLAVPGFPFGVAGMMGLTAEMKGWGIRPHWTGYIAVDDVDAMALDFQREGGAICRPPALTHRGARGRGQSTVNPSLGKTRQGCL